MTERQFPVSFDNLRVVAGDMSIEMDRFQTEHKLPEGWFAVPDHLAVKCADYEHYCEVMGQAHDFSSRQTELPLNGRMLGTSELKMPLALGRYGFVRWLEIMEPRPERVGRDKVGLDHVEFYFADHESVEVILGRKAIACSPESNPSHAWISFYLPSGMEIKLNDGKLADIVEDELLEGVSRVTWEAGK